jgi:acyl-CoA synthetase (AMP-forming)/AMP-acid ligase II
MRISDRSKDAIKSGGEWISSVNIENIAAGCPGVAEACCIGVPHPRWQERPLLLIVREPGKDVDEETILSYLDGRIAKWQKPDAIRFVDRLPRNGVGKVVKAQLRKDYQDVLL